MGDGASIHVTKDRWILNHPTNMVLHPPLEEEWEWWVADLIDWRFKTWNREFIEANFHREDAKAILSMPLSCRNASDLLMWLHTKNGEYTMRSGYHIARGITKQESDMGECSREVYGSLVWQHLWKLHLPNKIKVFGWRACQNVLPTRKNLACHKVIMDDGCEFCKMNLESVIHVLWQCGVAQDIWAGSLRQLQKGITGQTDFMQLVVDLIRSLSSEEQELF